MTNAEKAEQWKDPEIQALLGDVRVSIERYLKRKISRPLASESTCLESVEIPETPIAEASGQDKYISMIA